MEVFDLGSVIHFLLTNEDKWEDLWQGLRVLNIAGSDDETFNEKEVVKEVRSVILKDKHPPPEVLNSTDTVIKSMLQAWNASRVCDMNKLLSSREIANALERAAVRLGVVKGSPSQKGVEGQQGYVQ